MHAGGESLPLGYMGPVDDSTPKSGRPGSNICEALTGAGMGTYGTRRMFFFWGKLRGGVRARLSLGALLHTHHPLSGIECTDTFDLSTPFLSARRQTDGWMDRL